MPDMKEPDIHVILKSSDLGYDKGYLSWLAHIQGENATAEDLVRETSVESTGDCLWGVIVSKCCPCPIKNTAV